MLLQNEPVIVDVHVETLIPTPPKQKRKQKPPAAPRDGSCEPVADRCAAGAVSLDAGVIADSPTRRRKTAAFLSDTVIPASKRILVPLKEMETTEKRTKPSKDQEHFPLENGEAQSASLETRIILLGPEPSIPTASGEGEDAKSIQTGRDRRRRKQSVIVERDDDDEYR